MTIDAEIKGKKINRRGKGGLRRGIGGVTIALTGLRDDSWRFGNLLLQTEAAI